MARVNFLTTYKNMAADQYHHFGQVYYGPTREWVAPNLTSTTSRYILSTSFCTPTCAVTVVRAYLFYNLQYTSGDLTRDPL